MRSLSSSRSAPAARLRASLSPEQVEEILAEATFFREQGLFEESARRLRTAISACPEVSALRDALAALEAESAGARRSLRQASHRAHTGHHLDDLFADMPSAGPANDALEAEAILARAVERSDAQAEDDEAESHFDLGMAYREVGLTAEALREFRRCLASPTRGPVAWAMIGICHLDAGDTGLAAAAFERVLGGAPRPERADRTLHTDAERDSEGSGVFVTRWL
jgi:pilus assembly protein FimV